MAALRRDVTHVQVERRRVVGELDELRRAWMRARVVEQVHERETREDPATARRARRHRRRVEVAGHGEQRRRVCRVEHHVLAVLVEHHEVGAPLHGRRR